MTFAIMNLVAMIVFKFILGSIIGFVAILVVYRKRVRSLLAPVVSGIVFLVASGMASRAGAYAFFFVGRSIQIVSWRLFLGRNEFLIATFSSCLTAVLVSLVWQRRGTNEE